MQNYTSMQSKFLAIKKGAEAPFPINKAVDYLVKSTCWLAARVTSANSER